jgi:hypothetical protein
MSDDEYSSRMTHPCFCHSDAAALITFSAFLRREFVYGSVFYSFLLLWLSIPSQGIVGKARAALFGCETPMP